MVVVVVPVILATSAFAWWYRSSNPRAQRSPVAAYEERIEFVVWLIPALTLIFLGGVIWIGSHQLDLRAPIPAAADPLRVEVVALDWKWAVDLPLPFLSGGVVVIVILLVLALVLAMGWWP